MDSIKVIDQLIESHFAPDDALLLLLMDGTQGTKEYLFEKARQVQQSYFGKRIYLRGLIEVTNYCKNDCYYCGIRCSNRKAERYRLTKEQILECCRTGWELGFYTFVLQGGEDMLYSDQDIADIVSSIKEQFPKCAVTLSIGERNRESYALYKKAGADRYLLRHETADIIHYGRLHPVSMRFENRKRCLYDLRELGYQIGCGMMVGSPYQTMDHLLADLRFMEQLQPHMIGIGPFIHHKDTPFAEFPDGDVELTLRLLAILRLMFPQVLLPATTALGTLDPMGREKGILAGANVLMPNLSPENVRKKYNLYDNKLCTGDEAAQSIADLRTRIAKTGYKIVKAKGDFIKKS